MRPSEWITHSTELLLGLIDHDDKPGKSIEHVGAELRGRLESAEQNIRMFLAIRAVLETAAVAVELDVSEADDVLTGANVRLDTFITLYSLRVEDLKEERRLWQPGGTRLERVLKLLPAIAVERLRPSVDSLSQLKKKILDDARGEGWLRTKVESLECRDGISFRELLDRLVIAPPLCLQGWCPGSASAEVLSGLSLRWAYRTGCTMPPAAQSP